MSYQLACSARNVIHPLTIFYSKTQKLSSTTRQLKKYTILCWTCYTNLPDPQEMSFVHWPSFIIRHKTQICPPQFYKTSPYIYLFRGYCIIMLKPTTNDAHKHQIWAIPASLAVTILREFFSSALLICLWKILSITLGL